MRRHVHPHFCYRRVQNLISVRCVGLLHRELFSDDDALLVSPDVCVCVWLLRRTFLSFYVRNHIGCKIIWYKHTHSRIGDAHRAFSRVKRISVYMVSSRLWKRAYPFTSSSMLGQGPPPAHKHTHKQPNTNTG